MAEPDITTAAAQLADQILIWVGFGTIVGLLAKAVMPGRDPGGAVATLLMGIAGTVIGCAVLMYLSGGHRISPISPLGFVVGTAGAFVILFFYKLLAGHIAVDNPRRPVREPYYRLLSRQRRPQREVLLDD
jgi:uncharacterized membrane protein YeaQ/YmgE (transglycosylase-associated protein family)